MRIFLVGGGSGGHITPTLAVATKLKENLDKVCITYVVGKRDVLRNLVDGNNAIDKVVSIHSGKLRRYHGEGLKQLLDIPTVVLNIRDAFYIFAGIIESFFLLRRDRPDIIFIKGGFVGVPVGLMAALLRIPYITHDSDAVPGLANRIISHWASAHAVAMLKEVYDYPKAKTYQTGVPIADEYSLVTKAKQVYFKKQLGLDPHNPVLCVTGGGLGAQRLNEAVAQISNKLLARHPQLHILHITGKGKADEVKKIYQKMLGAKIVQVTIKEFVDNFYVYSGASDVIVARAGANSLAEFAAQAKACVIVPNPQLTGGHQLKNANILEESGAVIVVPDKAMQKNAELLLRPIDKLLADPSARELLAKALNKTSNNDATGQLAKLILDCVKKVSQ
ncbi:UDP-N-acetylglucosamine--N-acetylmuramyl-(pentapeptide) pyrophosphoryl-undecaprenol N-acetylglucosamine transferase [Candidatus Saccharibacteria bacterium]|nr:UDP-N-acetylglucosamine--N-acetylmuramyl-(pentapeptide) pyrophosphoryl-undecaprenol N-acetylglucosamine transferase [Candidatus Saccharibacteria bacterium]